MLTARSTSTHGLDRIRLALEILNRSGTVPQSLSTYFDKVVGEAVSLAADPSKGAAEVEVDAVRLAVEIRQDKEIEKFLQHFTRIADMTSEDAGELLGCLERQPAAA
jgi:hypothetical protein